MAKKQRIKKLTKEVNRLKDDLGRKSAQVDIEANRYEDAVKLLRVTEQKLSQQDYAHQQQIDQIAKLETQLATKEEASNEAQGRFKRQGILIRSLLAELERTGDERDMWAAAIEPAERAKIRKIWGECKTSGKGSSC